MILIGVLVEALAMAGCSRLPDLSPEPGCPHRSERLAEKLNNLAVLSLRPATASLREQGSGCDASSGGSYAERVYNFPGTPDEVTGFYRGALPAAGWKTSISDGSPNDSYQLSAAGLCFSKSIDGTATLLYVTFQNYPTTGDVPDPAVRVLDLTVVANSDEDTWC